MPISVDLQKRIEKDLLAQDPKKYLRPGIAYDTFLMEFGENINQMEKDKQQILLTGFDWSEIDYFKALHETALIALGFRIGGLPLENEEKELYDKKIQELLKKRRYLMAVGRHIVKATDDKDVATAFARIVKGTGTNDSLVDIISLSSFLQEFPELMGAIKPAGITIDKAFIDSALEDAVKILQARGIYVGNEPNEKVLRQSGLISLCVKAQGDLKEYAYNAFIDNLEHYNKYYASKAKRDARKSQGDIDSDLIAKEIPETDEVAMAK
jgi:Arc/MetJ family transcription regulator